MLGLYHLVDLTDEGGDLLSPVIDPLTVIGRDHSRLFLAGSIFRKAYAFLCRKTVHGRIGKTGIITLAGDGIADVIQIQPRDLRELGQDLIVELQQILPDCGIGRIQEQVSTVFRALGLTDAAILGQHQPFGQMPCKMILIDTDVEVLYPSMDFDAPFLRFRHESAEIIGIRRIIKSFKAFVVLYIGGFKNRHTVVKGFQKHQIDTGFLEDIQNSADTRKIGLRAGDVGSVPDTLGCDHAHFTFPNRLCRIHFHIFHNLSCRQQHQRCQHQTSYLSFH